MNSIELCPENAAAVEMLRPEKNDRSGVGVHYVDAYLKPLKAGVTLPDGTKFSAKRRGLKVILAHGPQKADALLRRLVHGPDPVRMLRVALDEAGAKIGFAVKTVEGKLVLEAQTVGQS